MWNIKRNNLISNWFSFRYLAKRLISVNVRCIAQCHSELFVVYCIVLLLSYCTYKLELVVSFQFGWYGMDYKVILTSYSFSIPFPCTNLDSRGVFFWVALEIGVGRWIGLTSLKTAACGLEGILENGCLLIKADHQNGARGRGREQTPVWGFLDARMESQSRG
jgi:hypothetical protein